MKGGVDWERSGEEGKGKGGGGGGGLDLLRFI